LNYKRIAKITDFMEKERQKGIKTIRGTFTSTPYQATIQNTNTTKRDNFDANIRF